VPLRWLLTMVVRSRDLHVGSSRKRSVPLFAPHVEPFRAAVSWTRGAWRALVAMEWVRKYLVGVVFDVAARNPVGAVDPGSILPAAVDYDGHGLVRLDGLNVRVTHVEWEVMGRRHQGNLTKLPGQVSVLAALAIGCELSGGSALLAPVGVVELPSGFRRSNSTVR